MSQQPIRLTKRGELVMGILSAITALILLPAAATAFVALLMVAP
ncbi:hypothetical protein ACFFGR_09480 [Arthrobacter liuii]|uniref:Uncharacterized protein n=1 Tax=Arthrobacter liuii TaxID=1476996 RepID=A0ABQ2AMS8_9MICC|nr:hypothetical protein [Arthrobacter liuii]GGH93934.1 hypothetical protein GCM10007170_15960 [Arthrobacter liuii]